jgi:hypothetical protein
MKKIRNSGTNQMKKIRTAADPIHCIFTEIGRKDIHFAHLKLYRITREVGSRDEN